MKQSWIGLRFAIKFSNSKLKKIGLHMLSSATIVYKLFWIIVSPLFIAKNGSKNKKIILVEDGKVFADDAKIAETFNFFFGSIVKTSFVIREMKLICYCRQ